MCMEKEIIEREKSLGNDIRLMIMMIIYLLSEYMEHVFVASLWL